MTFGYENIFYMGFFFFFGKCLYVFMNIVFDDSNIEILPMWFGEQHSGNICPCVCRKRRLTKSYKLSYTTGLLYAWPSCKQWGIWAWTVGHWVVLVQVIHCSKGWWVLFLEPAASLRGDPELQPQSLARSSRNSFLSLQYVDSHTLIFFLSSKTMLSVQGCGFCPRR